MLRNKLITRPIVAILAIAMLGVALACAGEDATPEPTSPPPTATSPAMTDGAQPTATPVGQVGTDVAWMERYLQSPGYDPAWGQPIKGGT